RRDCLIHRRLWVLKAHGGNLKLLINYVEKFLGTVKFRNDQIAHILGYGDLVQGAKSICYIRDLKGNDLLTGSRGTDLYLIILQDTNSPNPICLMAKVTSSQAWLWHRRLSHLNFDAINLLSKNDIVVGLPKLKFIKDYLCSSCELGKAKRKSFHTLRSPQAQKHGYNFYTWTYVVPCRLIQRGLQAQVRIVRIDKGTKILNQTLHAYFAAEGILHQTSVARTPEQNGVVKRQNRTLVEAARTMLGAAKVPLFFWAEAIATACFTQNRSLVIPRHEKTPYHIINDRKSSVKFFHIFGSLCYIVRDGENLDKLKEKDHVSSDPAPKCQRMALEHGSLSLGPQCVPLCQILHCLLTLLQLVEIVLFIVDSGCSKHMTGNLKLLINFVEKFLGTVKFRNDQIAPIVGYGDLVQ
nr:hypothetical protein [Tanacetum cinerariifolium]